MSTVAVIIPTFDRPLYLAEALESVRGQSARDQISEVLVSENGSTDCSEAVCRRFPDLPITYVRREPPLSALEQHRALARECGGDYTALLHDDDWWDAEHLSRSLQALDARPHLTAAFSSYCESGAPSVPGRLYSRVWLSWLASGCDSRLPWAELDSTVSLGANLVLPFCHFSTLVGRRAPVRDAWDELVAINNAFDCDRQLPVLLADGGGILFGSWPSICVRQHGGQDSASSTNIEKCSTMYAETTRQMVARWKPHLPAATGWFNETVARLKADRVGDWLALRETCLQVRGTHRQILVSELGFDIPSVDLPRPRRSVKSVTRRLIRMLRRQ